MPGCRTRGNPVRASHVSLSALIAFNRRTREQPVESTDRLAAYLADELTADERCALEAELVHDHALRTRLEWMRRADRALKHVAPTDAPEGFDERLHQAIDGELARLLGTATNPGGSSATRQIARHRTARSTHSTTVTPLRGWVPVLAGAAAALAAVGGIGLAVTNLVPTDDMIMMAGDSELGFDGATERAQPEAQLMPPGIASIVEMPGPVIIDIGRSINDHDLPALLDQPDLAHVARQLHDRADIAATAKRWSEVVAAAITAALGDASSTDSMPPSAAPEPGSPVHGLVLEPGSLRVTTSSPSAIDPGDLAAVGRCLQVLATEPAIPVYIELATDDAGQGVIVLGLVLVDATADTRDTGDRVLPGRRQVRVVDRTTCATLTHVDA